MRMLHLSRDAIHIHIGFAVLMLTVLLWKRPLSDWRVLLPGFLISLVMELLDLSDDISKSNFYPVEHIHDLVNTNLIPLVLVALSYLGGIRATSRDNSPSQNT